MLFYVHKGVQKWGEEKYESAEDAYESTMDVFGDVAVAVAFGDREAGLDVLKQGAAEGIVYYLDPYFGEGEIGEDLAKAVAENDYLAIIKEAGLLASLGPYADDFKQWVLEGVFSGNMHYDTRGPDDSGQYMMKVMVPEDTIYMKMKDEDSLIRTINVIRVLGGKEPLSTSESEPTEPSGNADGGSGDMTDPAEDFEVGYEEPPPVADVGVMSFAEWQATIGKGGSDLDYQDWLAGV